MRSLPTLYAVLQRERMGPLFLVCAVHIAGLWWLAGSLARAPEVVTVPSLIGLLVSEAPVTVEPQPLPVVQTPPPPAPKPRPRPRPAPPVPQAPPSELAVTAPPSEPVFISAEPTDPAPPSLPAPLAAAPTSAPVEAVAPLPVIPPRADASHLNNPAPVYPPESRRRREQGRVVFDVYVWVDGSVRDIRIKRSSGHARLDDAAFEAVRRWRYAPARRGDEPIPYWYAQPVDFVLKP